MDLFCAILSARFLFSIHNQMRKTKQNISDHSYQQPWNEQKDHISWIDFTSDCLHSDTDCLQSSNRM